MIKKQSNEAKPKICFKCQRKIEETSNYYSFVEINNLKIISVDHAHRVCWDNFLNQLTTLHTAQDMLGRMEGSLTSMGILKPKQQEVIIK